MKVLAILVVLSARAYAWPGESSLGASATVISVQASDDRYPYCSTVDVATARKLARSRFPRTMRSATIAATGRAMEVLANARWLGQLDKLWVCTDDRGLRALAQSRRLRKLVELQVASDGAMFDAAAVRALVASRRLGHLERLRFEGSDSEAEHSVDSGGAIEIATHARLPRLRALDLSWNPVDNVGVTTLVESALARRLDELDLCRTSLATDAVIAAKLTNLAHLCISDIGTGRPDGDDTRLRAAYGAVLAPDVDPVDDE